MTGPANHTPQKRWGQNFLHDQRAIERIANALDLEPRSTVLEIGPGRGALTAALLDRGLHVRAIEIDRELVAWLEEQFEGRDLEIVQGDAVHAPLPTDPFHAFGNLPYNVANPIIARVVREPGFLSAAFMVQKEVANRYTATPGRKDYGYLTLSTRLYATAEQVLELGPGAFRPQPKVRSAVIRLTRSRPDLETDAAALDRLISTAFRMRRKTLQNNLAGLPGLSKDQIAHSIRELGLPAGVRAESLDLSTFDRLAVALRVGSG